MYSHGIVNQTLELDQEEEGVDEQQWGGRGVIFTNGLWISDRCEVRSTRRDWKRLSTQVCTKDVRPHKQV